MVPDVTVLLVAGHYGEHCFSELVLGVSGGFESPEMQFCNSINILIKMSLYVGFDLKSSIPQHCVPLERHVHTMNRVEVTNTNSMKQQLSARKEGPVVRALVWISRDPIISPPLAQTS